MNRLLIILIVLGACVGCDDGVEDRPADAMPMDVVIGSLIHRGMTLSRKMKLQTLDKRWAGQ
jgi:hypothetical protein